MQVCRICLATDRKMYSFDIDLIRSYEQITGEAFVSLDLLPKYVCWECGYYLSKYVAFRRKAVTSQNILHGILSSGRLITHTTIGSIDRKKIKFLSNLTYSGVKYVCYNEEEDNRIDNNADVKNEDDDNDEQFDNFKDNFADDSIADAQDFKNEMLESTTKEINYLDTDSDPAIRCNNICIEIDSNNVFEDDEEFIEESCDQMSCNKRKRKSTEFKSDSNNERTDLSEESENSVNPFKKRNVEKKKEFVNTEDIKYIKKPKEISKKSQKVHANKKLMKAVRNKKVVPDFDKIDKNILNIKKLSFDEQTAEVEKRKLNDNYINSRFKCTYCFRGYLDAEKLNRHMEKHSESQGAYECKLCKLRYVAQYKLNLHMKTHLLKISCQMCSFTTGILNVAIKHQNHHKGKQYTCPHCQEIYTHASTYLSHLRIKHPSNFICQYCGNSFINERGLLNHQRYVHRSEQTLIPEDGPYCERCDIRFLCQSALDTHKQLSAKHVDERNSTQEKEKVRKRAKHRAKPTSEPFVDGPKPCEQCDERLPNAQAYYRHFRREHKDKNRTLFYAKKAHRYMCEICGKMLQNITNLRDHKFAHTETKQFKCEKCGRLFQLNAHLKLHQSHHCINRKPYPCKVCGKVFSNPSNVQRHMISHTGVRAYKCEMCDKTFTHSGNKKNHVEFVHKKKPWPKRNRNARKRTERQAEVMQQSSSDAAGMQQEWNSAL